MVGNWAEAARYSDYLKEECNWSRALFHYMHAVFLQHQMDLEDKKELKEEIEESLSLIPKIKRTIGGKLAFHDQRKKFCEAEKVFWQPSVATRYSERIARVIYLQSS